MPYPISIRKVTLITVKQSNEYFDIINALTSQLTESGNEIELNGNKIKILTCSEFCSHTTFKDFNSGQIGLVRTDDKVTVTFKIYLIEHLIIFLGVIALGIYGLLDDGADSILFKIALLLLVVNFVFCYLMPLMTLDAFIEIFIRRRNR